MLNIELLEKSIPVAPIKILALEGCKDLAQAVDSHLVKFRKELSEHNKSGLNPQGYSEESFIVECECPRFGTGEGKGYIRESVRGWISPITAVPILSADTKTICHRTTIIRI